MSSIGIVLRNVKNELKQKEKVREDCHKKTREIMSNSKQAILLIHQKKVKEAKRLIRKANGLLSKLYIASKTFPEIIYSGIFSAACQEYAEANLFLNLIEESQFASPEDIEVPSIDFVLGLADVIGEFRRLTLDALREGNDKKGQEYLQKMDEIYVELMAIDEAYLLPGLRRKLDVARKITEITRGDITQEVRRNALEKHLKHLERLVKRETKQKLVAQNT